MIKTQEKPTMTFLDWLRTQRTLTGEKEILADFAKAIHGSIIKIGFATNQQVSCRKLWMLMGEMRNSPAVQLGFMTSYMIYLAETNNADPDVEYVVDEITEMLDFAVALAKNGGYDIKRGN